MKHSFQVITISIIAVLTLVLCWQMLWLHGLYQSIRQETYATIMSAIETSDFNEIAYRVMRLNGTRRKRRRESIVTGEEA
jgi:hypothetical protein